MKSIETIEAEAHELAKAGNRVEAIKHMRQVLGSLTLAVRWADKHYPKPEGDIPTDAQLYAQARAHMEQWSGAASLARPLWDAVVREHDRLERELAEAKQSVALRDESIKTLASTEMQLRAQLAAKGDK